MLIQLIKNIYLRFAPPRALNPEEPLHWKEKVLYNFIILATPLVFVLLMGALPLILKDRLWFLMATALGALGSCILFFFLSSRLPYLLRALTVSVFIYFFSVAVIFSVGPFIASREWFLLFSLVAAILLGWPGAVFSISLNILTLVWIAFLLDRGFWGNLPLTGNPVSLWFQVALDFLFINLTSTLFVTYLFFQIERSNRVARSSAKLLGDERSKLIDANQSLEKEIAERKQLEHKLSQAQKMQVVGTIAGGVAHDLNNILSGVIGFPDLLLQDLDDDSPLRSPLLSIKKSGEKAADIVQDLLTLARRGVDTRKIVSLNQIIKDFLDSPEYNKILSNHLRIRLQTLLGNNVLNIVGSAVHISKTLMNLVANAIDAMPAGGEVTISTTSCYLDNAYNGYELIPEGEYSTLEVSDEGIGMPQSDLQQIFEPFYTKKNMARSGTGLGMSVIWGTVKDHEGFIDVTTAEGSGTTFVLYFPVTRTEVETLQSVHIDDYLGKGESILVIDDSSVQRTLAGKMMQRLGYSVQTAASGETALAMIEDVRYDLLILDMIMDPGMNGLQTYRKILQIVPDQKAVIASGFSETDMVGETQKLGAGSYIKKPYSLETIGIAVRSELDREK